MRHAQSRPSRKKAPHHVIIARGDKIRSFTLRPWATMGIGVFAVLFLGLYLAATAYLFFRDDVLNASLAKQGEIRQAYEERIALLRAQLDRVSSRQVVDQEAIQTRLEDLMGRQDAIAERQQILTGLAVAAREAGIAVQPVTPPAPAPNPARRDRAASLGEPALGDALGFAPLSGPVDKIASLQPAVTAGTPAAVAGDDPDQMLSTVASTLDLVEQDQIAAIQAVAQSVNGKTEAIADVLQSLGHRVPASNLGGPYVPIDGSDVEDFREGVAAVSDEIELLANLVDTARSLPLARPVANVATTSGFGRRLDPFLRRPAMHTGVDFGAASGTAVRATGPGRVIVAARTGGYGKMVEIDHGGGITTRYAHMSRISVSVGDIVNVGDVVGRVGSTGRSTGPHLHYEVRRSGRAIDPIPYLRAGDKIISLL